MQVVLEGLSANKGKVDGIVNVIENDKDISSFVEGHILVSKQTAPQFVVIMAKAKAIVTDLGGITAHAAILSRELGIPCVVGTQNATKLLKTGDKILVDADAGKVYRL